MGTVVQIYGAEHYDDAMAVAALGAHQLGFRVEDPSFIRHGERCISAQEARRIFSDLPSDVVTVSLFATPDEDLILRTVDFAMPDSVQFCWEPDAMDLQREVSLRERLHPIQVIRAIPVGGSETRAEAVALALRYQELADLLILDTRHPDQGWVGAAGLPHDWSISRDIARQSRVPCILAGGLDADNVREGLRAVSPWGVDSYSRTSLPDDRKDLGKVQSFIEAVQLFDSEALA
jgi:phosphoribosylanthranilate isomerase